MDTLHRTSLGEMKQLLGEKARGLESFLAKKLDGNPGMEKALDADLWNGAEPEFEQRWMSFLHTQLMLWELTATDMEALQFVLVNIKNLPLSGHLATDELRKYLQSLSQACPIPSP
jgi:hypothetical protein